MMLHTSIYCAINHHEFSIHVHTASSSGNNNNRIHSPHTHTLEHDTATATRYMYIENLFQFKHKTNAYFASLPMPMADAARMLMRKNWCAARCTTRNSQCFFFVVSFVLVYNFLPAVDIQFVSVFYLSTIAPLLLLPLPSLLLLLLLSLLFWGRSARANTHQRGGEL